MTTATDRTAGYRNASDLLARRARQAPRHVAFEVPDAAGSITTPWRQVTTVEFESQVRALAKGLIAVGLQPGQSVAVMSPTRYEWAVADLAAWYAGAVVVPIYETSAQPQVTAILADADVRLAIAGTAAHAALLRTGLAQPGLRPLGVWSIDPDPGADLADLVARGAGIADDVVEHRRGQAGLDSVATIVYTSGTTAAPKGALITHGNLVGKVLSVADAYTEVVREDGNTVIFLPLAHVLARGLQLICLTKGMRIAHLADPRDVVPAVAVLRPTFLVVVPRVLQKVQAAAAAAAASRHLGPVWAAAQRTAIEWGRHSEAADADPGVRPGRRLRLRHRLFDRLFYSRLRDKLGRRIDYLLSGAARLDTDLSLFFRGIGLPVVEGYGLTETTAPLTANLPGAIRSGTVGVPLPGTELRISEEGEVLARGVGVFPGYHNPADNAAAFVDGWFRTGDLGALDATGRLTLLGRLKDVIVTSGGKTISPALWESQVEADPLVAHAVMVGEGKPYLGGLVLLDPESVQQWAERAGIGDQVRLPVPGRGAVSLVEDSRLVAAVAAAIGAANAQLARSEQVRRFALLLADLSDIGGIVTPTLKMKRAAFTDRVRDIVESLYADTSDAALAGAPGRRARHAAPLITTATPRLRRKSLARGA